MDLIAVIGQLLPVGIAAAVSTVPVTVVIVILLSPRRNVVAIPYALGYVGATALIVVLTAAAAQLLPEPRPREPQTVVAVLELLLGAALVVLGLIGFRRRGSSAGGSRVSDRASAMISTIGAVKAGGVGVIMGLRPKSVLLAGVVALQLNSVTRDTGVTGIVIIYVAMATSTVTVPVLLTMLAQARMEPRLKSAGKVLAEQGPMISAIVLVMVGAMVIGIGLQDF